MTYLPKLRFAKPFDSLPEFVKSVEPPAKVPPFIFLSSIDKKFNNEPEADRVSATPKQHRTQTCLAYLSAKAKSVPLLMRCERRLSRRRSWARQSSGALPIRIPKSGDSGYV